MYRLRYEERALVKLVEYQPLKFRPNLVEPETALTEIEERVSFSEFGKTAEKCRSISRVIQRPKDRCRRYRLPWVVLIEVTL